MKYIRKSSDRGELNRDGLHSYHTFSFGQYYDPKHLGISVLSVINEDTIQPNHSVAEHRHRNMEIISYVIEGALSHSDSLGNYHTISAGEVQRMSAGRGLMHSEFNASDTEPVKFLQIWIQPSLWNIKPNYEQKVFPSHHKMTLLATPTGDNESLMLHQDVILSRLILLKDESLTLKTTHRVAYCHFIKGACVVNDDSDERFYFNAGDGFYLESHRTIEITAEEDIEAIWFDLPLPT